MILSPLPLKIPLNEKKEREKCLKSVSTRTIREDVNGKSGYAVAHH